MLDNDDPDAPNGGKPLLLRMSKNDREMLDQLCERTGLNPSDAVRAAIRFANRSLVGEIEAEEAPRFAWEVHLGEPLSLRTTDEIKRAIATARQNNNK
jgi:Arc/MetJ-type ribon-helix-helix transcriptional regulator